MARQRTLEEIRKDIDDVRKIVKDGPARWRLFNSIFMFERKSKGAAAAGELMKRRCQDMTADQIQEMSLELDEENLKILGDVMKDDERYK